MTRRLWIAGDHQRLSMAYDLQPGRPGPPVVWIHGMGSSRLAFTELMALSPIPGDYYALDLPGFGASSLPRRRQDLPQFVDATWSFITALRLDGPVLVGHSFGGMVAALTAIAHPRQVRGIILVSAAGIIPPVHAFQPTRWVCVNRIGIWVTSLNTFGNGILRTLGLDPARVTPLQRARMRYGWRRSREMARMGRFYEAEDLVGQLVDQQIPVVGIWGDADQLFPPGAVEAEIRGRFPLWYLKGAGHLPYDYDVEQFGGLLARAYDRLMDCHPQNAVP